MTKKMHILFIPSWYNSKENPDDNNFISNQIQGVKNLGLKVGVLFLQNTLHQLIKGKIIPIQTKALSVGSFNELRLITPIIPIKYRLGQWVYEKLAHRLYKQYEKRFGTPDILHAHGYLAAIMANYISQKIAIKVIITEHANDILMDRLLPHIRKKVALAYENSNKLISVGYLLKSGMSKLTSKEIEVIPNCIDTDLFCPAISKEPAEKVIILISSYLFKHKEVDLALYAMKILKDRGVENIELRIAGIGPEMKNLNELAKKLELRESVKFEGLVLNRNLPKVMQEADILLVTCPTETFCVALIEGLSCGLRAVVPASGEPARYAKPFGVVVAEKHTAEWYSQKINDLIEQRYIKHEANLIHNKIKSRYSIQIVAKQILELYTKVLTSQH